MRKLSLALVVVFLALVLGGCATVNRVPLSKDTALSFKGKACEISRHKTPGFQASTADKAALGPLIGVPLAFSEGKEIVAKHNIEDPAIHISRELAKILGENLDIKILPEGSTICENSSLDTVCSTYKNGDIILDVTTLNWFFAYKPLLWTKYNVFYAAQLRLIDTKTKEVLAAEIFSKFTDYDATTAPTYDELLANNAERLKQELRIATDEAVKYFKEKGFNIQQGV